jgi:CHC2-type zinc finger protein/Toprim domain-containing protein
MKFRNNLPTVEEVKNTDMVDYLQRLGIKPAKVTRNDYWFLSPFRDEKVPSFKVNRSMNRWYDFGEGKGGNLIDFGILYHHCSVKEFLEKMNTSFSFHQQNIPANHEDEEVKKIKVINAKKISSLVLIRYLHKRRIPIDIASKFCKEIDYELYGKRYYALGFKNDAGGYELRNEKFKASSSPKDITLIKNNAANLTVFEGFFNFLSYLAIHKSQEQPCTDFLILNSTTFFEKSLPLMQLYKCKHLYLDCDTTGQKCIQKTQAIDKESFIDERALYKNYKDLNDWIMHIGQSQKQNLQAKL